MLTLNDAIAEEMKDPLFREEWYTIEDELQAERLASALEKAEEYAKKHPREVKLSRPCKELTREEIRQMFGQRERDA